MKKIIFPFLFCVASVCFAETVSDYQIKSDIDKYWAAREQCDRLKSNPIKNFLSVISKPYDCQEADRRLKEIELKGYCLEYGKFRRCGQYEEKDIASLINDYAEQSKQCSDDNSQSFPCVKKKLIAKSLESFGYKLSPDGTWQDAKPENLRFTPISNVKKASDKDLLNQFRLSNENMKYYGSLNNSAQVEKYRKLMMEAGFALGKRDYCFDSDPSGGETARRCTKEEIAESRREEREIKEKIKEELDAQKAQLLCMEYAGVFMKSLAWRDAGRTPKQLYDSLSPRYLSKQETKNIINAVYFNERYASLPYYEGYRNMFYTECMKIEGGYKPLP